MKFDPENPSALAAKILEAEAKLDLLAQKIAEIGQPAAFELSRRLQALRIEEQALKRNFEESISRGEPDSVRMEKIEALLRHIEREEDSVEHDADFLQQAAPSSMGLAVEAGAQVVDLAKRGFHKILGNHHPLGTSVFVNHTHDNLTAEYGLREHGEGAAPAKPPVSE